MIELKELKGLKGLKRNTIDKFYTKPEISELCCDCIKEENIINNQDFVIEPSAGNGSFIPHIKKLTDSYIFYDIQPENQEITKQDFLKLDETKLPNKDIHVIGNPPFGRQSSLAKKFIKKACCFSKSISFILPKSFKKDSYKNCFNFHFHLLREIDLPQNSFTIDNKDYDVPCVFQIWIKKDTPRVLPKKLEPKEFYSFVNKNEADISFRRVGFKAGNIDKITRDKNEQTHYFIKVDADVDNIIELMKEFKFNTDNTVGPKSISKQELIQKMNNIQI